MSAWLLDTDVVAELLRRRPEPRVAAWEAAQDAGTLFLSVLTFAELDQGLAKLPADDPRLPRLAAGLAHLEQRFAGRLLPLSDNVVRRYSRLSGSLGARMGQRPPVIDTLLAATAIEHGLALVTRNIKDVALTGTLLLDPWNEEQPSVRV
jgi:predicted nucleic acid-binding protein